MISNSILFPLLSITIWLSFFTPSLGQSPKLCRVRFPLADGSACGDDGNFRCIDEAVNIFSANKMPQKCSCSTDSIAKTSECHCSIVCESPDPSNSTEINLQSRRPREVDPPCSSSYPCPSKVYKTVWPELVGKKGEVAKAVIEEENPTVFALLLGCHTKMIHDFCCNRVEVWLNCDGIVHVIPRVG